MANEKLNTALYEKIFSEQEIYRAWLLSQPPEEIYLKNYEPHELVHFGGNTYCTRGHDSLKTSNGKW